MLKNPTDEEMRQAALQALVRSEEWPEFLKIVASEAKSARSAILSGYAPEAESNARSRFQMLKTLITRTYNDGGETVPESLKNLFE